MCLLEGDSVKFVYAIVKLTFNHMDHTMDQEIVLIKQFDSSIFASICKAIKIWQNCKIGQWGLRLWQITLKGLECAIESQFDQVLNIELDHMIEAGLIRTTRPTHYHVLFDEVGFSADYPLELVHSLSYVY
jgi:hypothetical protein